MLFINNDFYFFLSNDFYSFFHSFSHRLRPPIWENRSGECEHSCLVPNRGKAFSFAPFSMMLDVDFVWMPFIRFRKFSFISSMLGVFIMNRYWILSNAFFASTDVTMWFFFFRLLARMTIKWFWNIFEFYIIESVLGSCTKPHLVIVYCSFLKILLDSTC